MKSIPPIDQHAPTEGAKQEYQRLGFLTRRRFFQRLPAGLAVSIIALILPAALAQYPGQVETKKKEPTLRSIAVVEWEGAAGKPSASRIIPIAVYDGQNYQPGGLYLARPAPLALQSGTEYILESAGRRRGFYDVDTARDVNGYWIGYGQWKPLTQPKTSQQLAKTKAASKTLDPGRPHYGSGGNGETAQSSQTAPPAKPAPAPPAQNQQPTGSTPRRPVLRHRPATSNADASFLPTGPETETNGSLDPGRPHLSYGSKNPTNPKFKLSKLTGTPIKMQQMVAISDAANRKPQSFVFSWANPEDAGKMKAALEKIAVEYLAGSQKPEPHATEHGRRRTSAARRERRHAPAQPKITLTNEQFKAYGLTYSGGATLVFSAQTEATPGKVRYITLIAHPDFYGVPQILFKSMTSDGSLDQTPKMKLIDAADTEGDGRGDLIFELASRNSRQFAIYQVAGGQVQQLFTTGPLEMD